MARRGRGCHEERPNFQPYSGFSGGREVFETDLRIQKLKMPIFKERMLSFRTHTGHNCVEMTKFKHQLVNLLVSMQGHFYNLPSRCFSQDIIRVERRSGMREGMGKK